MVPSFSGGNSDNISQNLLTMDGAAKLLIMHEVQLDPMKQTETYTDAPSHVYALRISLAISRILDLNPCSLLLLTDSSRCRSIHGFSDLAERCSKQSRYCVGIPRSLTHHLARNGMYTIKWKKYSENPTRGMNGTLVWIDQTWWQYKPQLYTKHILWMNLLCERDKHFSSMVSHLLSPCCCIEKIYIN